MFSGSNFNKQIKLIFDKLSKSLINLGLSISIQTWEAVRECEQNTKQLTNNFAKEFWMLQPWYQESRVTPMQWWCNNNNKSGGTGFKGYIKLHFKKFGLRSGTLTDLQIKNILMCVNDTDEPMINVAQCNVFFEKIWSNKKNRNKLLGRDAII